MSIVELEPQTQSCFKSTKLVSIRSRELQSKRYFVNVSENIKPESGNSGCENEKKDSTNSGRESGKLGIQYTPSLSEPPNLFKQTGGTMSDEGFVKLPRSLLNDPIWKGTRDKYKKVFLTLLFNASYSDKSFSIRNNVVTIGPGQFCSAIRNLVDLCNDGVKFKEDKIDKNIVERAVSLFVKIGFVRQEVRHGKSIITITYPELYEHFQKQSETSSETKVRLNRDTNEERKEREDIRETIDRADAPVRSSLLNLEKEEQQGPSAFEAPKPRPSKDPLSEVQQKQYEQVWPWLVKMNMADGYTLQNANGKTPKGIKSSDLIAWLKTYPFDTIAQVIKQVQKETVDLTYPGYIVKLFKANVVAKKSNMEINDAYVKSVIAQTKCTHLEDLKQYVRDLSNDNDFQKNLPPDVFKGMIDNSLRQAKERETEERYNRDNEDDYY